MAIITLTTDFGLRDYMAASVKGSILKELPDANIIDVSHQITPFNLSEAAYVVKNAYPNFPPESIHVIGVDALPTQNNRLIAARIDRHFFVCADNGILSLLISEINPQKVVHITPRKFNDKSNFPTRDVFVPAACHLARGGSLDVLGGEISDYKNLSAIHPQLKENNVLIGTIIYIDNFGNVVTNISEKKFNDARKGRSFEIKVRTHSFNNLVSRYCDVVKDFEKETFYHGNGMALFNSAGFLEIAIYKSNPSTVGAANTLFGLKLGDNITVEFN